MSNTPLQALVTLNNEVVCRGRAGVGPPAAGCRGERRPGAADAGVADCAWPGRRRAEELSAFGELLADSRQWYAEHAGRSAGRASARFNLPASPPSEAAAWVATVRIMLNLDEFLTRE